MGTWKNSALRLEKNGPCYKYMYTQKNTTQELTIINKYYVKVCVLQTNAYKCSFFYYCRKSSLLWVLISKFVATNECVKTE